MWLFYSQYLALTPIAYAGMMTETGTHTHLVVTMPMMVRGLLFRRTPMVVLISRAALLTFMSVM